MNDISEKRLHILIVTEGTYPYYWGGVSTWCHLLLRDLPNIDFTLMSIVGDPGIVPQFSLPANVVDFRPIFLWGIREVLETRKDLTLLELVSRRTRTNEKSVEIHLVPLLRAFLEGLYADSVEPEYLGKTIHSLYRYFLAYDFDTSMRSQVVWELFQEVTMEGFPRVAAQYGYAGASCNLSDVTACMQWLYHWLFPLAAPLPKTDIVHAAMAGICTIVAVAAKLEHGAAYMLTEHGIYIRERYLAEATSSTSLFRKIFSLRFARRITELSYAMADQIAPCCDYNQRWELRNGAKPEQIKTIYYGVDSVIFAPIEKPADEPPIVVWVGRIDPLKDLLTLLQAAAFVNIERPDIEFRLFGSAPPGNEAYYEQCLQLRKELGLEETVKFAGFRANPAGAFNEGDIAVLSSVSEAFPFVILEAMLCEKPVVATAVGGVPEQIKGCGIVVEPRNPQAMADGILRLMADADLRKTLGKAARAKALLEYSVRQSGMAHEEVYRRLSSATKIVHQPEKVTANPLRQHENGHTFQLVAEEIHQHNGTSGNGNGSVKQVRNLTNFMHIGDGGSETTSPYQFAAILSPTRRRNSYIRRQPNHKSAPTRSTSEIETAWQLRKAPAIALLADETAQRCYDPIDSLEITALLESRGVTDEVAIQYFDAPDAFALGEAVLGQMRVKGLPTRPLHRLAPPFSSRLETIHDHLRGLLSLVPPVMLLVIVATFARLGQWTSLQLLLLSLGMTCSMLVSNGFVQAISRRTSLYLGMRKPAMAARFVRLSTVISASTIVGIALLVLFLFARFSVIPINDIIIFLCSFVGIAIIWLTAGSLSLLQRGTWLSIALATGLLAGILTTVATMSFLPAHLALGASVGFAVSMAVIILALRRGFANQLGAGIKNQMHLPSLSYMLAEAVSYWSYGSIYMIFIFVPHLIGWAGSLPGSLSRASAFTTIELGLTISLLPLLLTSGVADHTLRLFWRQAIVSQAQAPGKTPAQFGRSLSEFCLRQRKTYITALCLLTIITYLTFDLFLNSSVSDSWFQAVDKAQFAFVFHCGLVSYALLGVGLFNSMFSVTLGQPRDASITLLIATVFMISVGYPFSMVSYEYSVIGFVCASFVFAVLSGLTTNRVLRSADFYFASVL